MLVIYSLNPSLYNKYKTSESQTFGEKIIRLAS